MYEDFIKILKKDQNAPCLFLIGEDHYESELRREVEMACLENQYGKGVYLTEDSMPSGYLNAVGNPVMSDSLKAKSRVHVLDLLNRSSALASFLSEENLQDFEVMAFLDQFKKVLGFMKQEFTVTSIREDLQDLADRNLAYMGETYQVEDPFFYLELLADFVEPLLASFEAVDLSVNNDLQDFFEEATATLHEFDQRLAGYHYPLEEFETEFAVNMYERDYCFLKAAQYASEQGLVGFWKIGDDHIQNLLNPELPFFNEVKQSNFKVISLEDFNILLGKYETNKQEVLKKMDQEITSSLKFSKKSF